MNVHDVEDTLHTLEARHPGLNETMLLTLLKAGGWEEKDIEMAKVVFRSSSVNTAQKEVSGKLEKLPPLQEEPVFEPEADESHRIEGPAEEDAPEALPPKEEAGSAAEPVSLISEENMPIKSSREDLPHNLPLRPFETSEHIWPFSRYRDVFYGEEADRSTTEPSSYDVHHVQNVILRDQVTESVVASKEKRGIQTIHSHAESVRRQSENAPPLYNEGRITEKKVVIVEKTGDEKLIIMASIMLLAILLLLGYMYSNGRL